MVPPGAASTVGSKHGQGKIPVDFRSLIIWVCIVDYPTTFAGMCLSALLELLAYAKGNRSPDGFLVKKEAAQDGQQKLEGWKGVLLLGMMLLKNPSTLLWSCWPRHRALH